MDPRDHIFAVVDSIDDSDSTLRLAKDAVDHGGRATVLVHLGASDRTHIREYAASEELDVSDAEARYVDSTLDRVRSFIGSDSAPTAVVTNRVPNGQDVVRSAVDAEATAIAVPSSLVGRRSWRRVMSRTPVQVIVTPSAA